MFGHCSIYDAGWRAVCPWPGPNFTEAAKDGRGFGTRITPEILEGLDRCGWELYTMADDPTESRNVAAEHPEVVTELIALWWTEAERYKVLPLDGSAQARLATERPQTSKPRDRFVYYPGGSVVPAFAAPMIYNRPYSIEADVDIPAGGAEGVLVAQGGDVGGYTFYVKDGQLHVLYNYVGPTTSRCRARRRPQRRARTRCASSSSRPASWTSPTARAFPGAGSCYIDGELVGATEFPDTTPLLFEMEGLSGGYDFGAPASRSTTAPFPFTGTIRQVAVDLASKLNRRRRGRPRS